MARGCAAHCNWDLEIVQTPFDNCIDGDDIGQGLMNGWYHSCVSYTSTRGQRQRSIEFSESILKQNKPAGLLVRLEDGIPTVSPMSDLSGLKVVDISGWAPTSDGLSFITNSCTGQKY